MVGGHNNKVSLSFDICLNGPSIHSELWVCNCNVIESNVQNLDLRCPRNCICYCLSRRDKLEFQIHFERVGWVWNISNSHSITQTVCPVIESPSDCICTQQSKTSSIHIGRCQLGDSRRCCVVDASYLHLTLLWERRSWDHGHTRDENLCLHPVFVGGMLEYQWEAISNHPIHKVSLYLSQVPLIQNLLFYNSGVCNLKVPCNHWIANILNFQS